MLTRSLEFKIPALSLAVWHIAWIIKCVSRQGKIMTLYFGSFEGLQLIQGTHVLLHYVDSQVRSYDITEALLLPRQNPTISL